MRLLQLLNRSLLAASIASIAACAGFAASAQEREFTVYDDGDSSTILAAFEKYYEAKTGQQITIRRFSQPGEELALTLQLEARSGSVKADAVMLQHYAMREIQQKYHIFEAPLDVPGKDDPALIPNLLDPVGDGSAVPIVVFPWVFVYNKNLVAAEDIPHKWSDLLNKRWAGKIGFGDPEATNGGATSLWFVSQYLADKDPAYGWAFYDKMRELQPYLASSHGALMEMVVSGELEMSIGTLFAAAKRAAAGDPIDVAQADEGNPVSIQPLAVVKGSPNADIGHALAEWAISKEGAEATLATQIGLLPIRTDVVNAPTPFKIDYSAARFVPVDPDWLINNRSDYLQKFRDALR